MRHFNSLDELVACVGQDVALSDWVLVDQARIQAFADATGDQQWIHVDEARRYSQIWCTRVDRADCQAASFC
jgi:acyl dehydratase